MDRSGIVGALVVLVVVAGGCGAEELSPPPAGTLCTPGDEAACTCESGLPGTMMCSVNGRAFDKCVCNRGGNADGGVVPVVAGHHLADTAARPARPDRQ